MLGEGIDVCSIEELHQLENQLERGLTRIRAKKVLLSKKTVIMKRYRFHSYIH